MRIYDEIGGAAAVSAAVDDSHQKVLAGPQLVGYFGGVDVTRLKSHQRSFIAAAIGGREPYVGRNMAAAHGRLNGQPRRSTINL